MSSKTVECLPVGICSWNYEITGTEENFARIEIAQFSEQGSMEVNGERFSINKPSIFHGGWTLSHGDQVIFSAEKFDFFTRTIKINTGEELVQLRGTSPFTREMTLQGNGVSCLMAPQHPFTRRGTISGNWNDFRLVVFGFWLVAISWKRAAQSN